LLASASNAIGKGANVGDVYPTLCGSVPSACEDAAGVARPTTGAWDIGAYEH
jgi:hypothetical protein